MFRSSRISRRRFVAVLGATAASAFAPAATRARRHPRHALGITGRVIAKGDANYEEWRHGMPWQMVKPERYPEIIVQPRDATEVMKTVNFARRNGLKVGVKSGGHHVWANFLRDGGLLLDLSQFRTVDIDREQRIARAGPAIWARNLIRATLPHGLGFPVAHCATVPLGGFLLGGGFGINGDEWGTMSALAVRGAQVVTAGGDLVEVDARRHRDLFWALRGAGNGFPGVVTRFDLELFPATPTVLASTYVFAADRIADVAMLATQLARSGLRHAEILGIVAIAGQDASGRNQVICALRVAAFAPDIEESRALLVHVATNPVIGTAVAKFESTQSDWDAMFLDSIDAARGFGFGRYAVDNLWTAEPAAVLELLADRLRESPSRFAHAVMQFKVRTLLPSDVALSRIAPAYAGVYSVWRDASHDASAMQWLRDSMAPLARHAVGRYINEIDAEARPQSITDSFAPAAWRQLIELRQRRDRSAVFHDFFGRESIGRGAST